MFLDDFPQAGNTEQFMALVVTGLQQNPHLIEEKREHIALTGPPIAVIELYKNK